MPAQSQGGPLDAAESAVRQVRAAAEAVVSDVAEGRWIRAGRRAGWLGVSVGVVAAGAAAGLAVERLTAGRSMRRRARAEVDASAPFGSLRGAVRRVPAEDGTLLHVELDGTGWPEEAGVPCARSAPAAAAAAAGAGQDAESAVADVASAAASALGRLRRLGRPAPQPPTVVFCHGYCLTQDSWHFQRAALREGLRLVFWDQRSHGRSERGRSYLAGEPATIDQLGRDLKAVIDAVAPRGPLFLVGHSMGGMTVMALAAQYPELFRDRVCGVALIGTSAGNLAASTFGLPAYGAKMFQRMAPGVLKALGRQPALVERGRRASSELTAPLYRRYSFGSPDVDPAVARFAERMLDSTPIDVVAEYFPALAAHDKTGALAAFSGLPVLVLTGTADLLTPPDHARAIVDELPDAELVLVPGAGHLVMLEQPDEVNTRLARLLARSARGAALPAAVRELAAAAPESGAADPEGHRETR